MERPSSRFSEVKTQYTPPLIACVGYNVIWRRLYSFEVH
jgi:hypothetical protein